MISGNKSKGMSGISTKYVEQHQNLHLLFIDLMQAFDTVKQAELWAKLSELGCMPQFVDVIRSFHEGMLKRVIEK